MKKAKLVIPILCLLFLFPASFSWGQPSGVRMGPGMEMRHWRGENRCWKASDLDLSPDRARSLEVIRRDFLRETRSLRIDLFSRRLELKDLLTSSSAKIESIQAKTSEIIHIQSVIEEKTTDYLVKVRALLTQEQVKNWCPDQEFPPMHGMMQRPEPMGPLFPGRPPVPERTKED